eukprot:TRINITY_DN8549_c0_g1_i1.p1 TRINITY_DN8549_c0_g1~~TRINITY_DN8549_c0_g1_i1.p1  ORF type:complete len:500 (+),score=151.11 TRINITY_DN8549_c0_g1_i1:203-1702(+)
MAPKKKKAGKKKAESNEPVVDVENNVVVLQYELAESRKSLEQFRENYVRQRRENEDLNASLSSREKEHFELINYLRQENERKDRVIASLNESLKEQRHLLEKDHETVTKHFQAKMVESDELKAKERAVLRKEIERLTEKLDLLEKFTQQRDILETEVRRLRVEKEELSREHKETLTNWEQKFFDEKRRVQWDMDKIVEEIKRTSKEDAIERLGERTKTIMHEHAKMVEELQYQAEETEQMRVQRDGLEGERKLLMRDKSLHESTFMELAREGAVSKKSIRALTSKVRLLEDSLKEVTRQNSMERQRVVTDLQQQLEERTREAEQLRGQLKLKSKELKHIRRLSQMILEQRSEVEQFFVEALEQVKLEKSKQKEDEKRKARTEQARQYREHGGTRPLTNPLVNERPPVWGDDKIHLKDLDFEDRERVLRLLFAKINVAQKGNSRGQQQKLVEEEDEDEEYVSQGNKKSVYLTQLPEDGGLTFPSVQPLSLIHISEPTRPY